MSTKYTWYETPECPHCGRGFEGIDIGHSDEGWNFEMYIYPSRGINNISDWIGLLYKEGSIIRDTPWNIIRPERFFEIVLGRTGTFHRHNRPKYCQTEEDGFHRHNNSERSCNGLVKRRAVEGDIVNVGSVGPITYIDVEQAREGK